MSPTKLDYSIFLTLSLFVFPSSASLAWEKEFAAVMEALNGGDLKTVGTPELCDVVDPEKVHLDQWYRGVANCSPVIAVHAGEDHFISRLDVSSLPVQRGIVAKLLSAVRSLAAVESGLSVVERRRKAVIHSAILESRQILKKHMTLREDDERAIDLLLSATTTDWNMTLRDSLQGLAKESPMGHLRTQLESILAGKEVWFELNSQGFHESLMRGRVVSRVFVTSSNPSELALLLKQSSRASQLVKAPSVVKGFRAILVAFHLQINQSSDAEPVPLAIFAHAYAMATDQFARHPQDPEIVFSAIRARRSIQRPFSLEEYGRAMVAGIKETPAIRDPILVTSTRGLCLQCHQGNLGNVNVPEVRSQILHRVVSNELLSDGVRSIWKAQSR
jgi:hypothetical protein